MPWFRISDDATDHPKVEAAGNEAFGLWVRLGAYAARQLTDGVIPGPVAVRYGDQALIDRLVAVRLLDVVEGGGWAIHDYLDHNPSRAEILADRAVKKAAAIDPELRGIVKARDGNRCRYQGCGRLVNWADRRTVRGGVLDLVDPTRPVNLNNLVVACRGCQKRHVGRAAEHAGMALGPIPQAPPPPGPGRPGRSRSHLESVQNQPGSDPGPIQIPPGSRPDPIQTPYPVPSPPLRGGGDGTEGTQDARHAAPDPGRPALAAVPEAPAPTPDPAAPAGRRGFTPVQVEHVTDARQTLTAKVRAAGLRLVSRSGKPIHVHPEPAYRQSPLPLYLELAPDLPAAPPLEGRLPTLDELTAAIAAATA
ncbi:hypothetical protein BBK14_01970 [Parafrankia soli]|uniref:HNH endonuclease n=1 Tax=Parafrankia soli TaxID=2599596 RepID=A0A1S1RLE7_9ACTN|nr:hypothetical protein [Parafrankia soli]OHV46639.1 hypothetical protein BBK14_01970 [Parafrankia soli]